jgi:hypothetical protein
MLTVTTSTVSRLSGLALLVALPVQIVGLILHPPGERLVDLLSPLQGPAHLVLFGSWLCLLLGLPGLYVWQARRAGLLGLLAFVALACNSAYSIYVLLYEAFPAVLLAHDPRTADLIATGGPLAHGAGAFGDESFMVVLAFPLFGLATLRAGVLPRLVGWLQIAAVPAFVLSMIALSAVLTEGGLATLPGPLQPIAVMYYLVFSAYAWAGRVLWSGRAAAPAPARTAVAHAAT